MPEFQTPISDRNGAQDLVLHRTQADSKARVLYLEPVDTTVSTEKQAPGLLDYVRLLWGKKIIIALFLVVGMAFNGIQTLRETPLYQARTTMEVITANNGESLVGLQDSQNGGAYETYIQTQIKVLQSQALRRKVINKLRQENHISTFVPADRLSVWRKKLGFTPTSARPPGYVPPVTMSIAVLEGSRIVQIVCQSPDPEFAAAFANAIVSEYIDYSLESSWQSGQKTVDWLSRQLQDLGSKLQASEAELQAYTSQAGLTASSEPGTLEEAKLKQVQGALSEAAADRMAKQAAYTIARASPIEAIPQVLDNERLSTYQSKLAELRRTLAEAKATYTDAYPGVARIQAQISEMETTLQRERASVLTRIKNDYDSARGREQLLSSAYDEQSQAVSEMTRKALRYGLLKREVETSRQLYEEVLHKVKQIGISTGLPAANVHPLDAAEAPGAPFSPDLLRDLLIGSVGGALLGVVVVIGAEFANRSLRSPGESAFHLQVPELGVIPASGLKTPSKNGLFLSPGAKGYEQNGNGTRPECVELATWQSQGSDLAESFRSVLASLLSFRGVVNRPHVMLVTSAVRGEGKSSVVSNMGIALAELDQKVILIDTDLRKPRLHEIFNVPNSWGLTDLLREQTSLADCPLEALARPTEIRGLYVLPSGPGTVSITNLLYSGRMAALLQRLRKEFDTILLDTPPISYLSDARFVGRLADGAILVIRAGRTTRDMALSAKQRLVADGIPVFGTVLNAWDATARSGYADYYYPYVHDVNR